MNIRFQCRDCGGGGDTGTMLFAAAINAVIDGGEIPKGPAVVDCASRVLVQLLDLYVLGKLDEVRLEAELLGLAASLKNKEDDSVRALGVFNRQAVWSCLGVLRREREKRHGKGKEGGGKGEGRGEGKGSG